MSGLPPELAQEAIDALARSDNPTAAARLLGLPRETFMGRLRRAEALGLKPFADREYSDLGVPSLPSAEVPLADLVRHRVERFKTQWRARQAREWIPIRVATSGPFCLAFVGDPHVDDNGCNWPLLERDLDLLRKHKETIYAVGMGDYANFWRGRLAAKVYPHQETTAGDGWRLVEHILTTVPWRALILGNHDLWTWGEGASPFDAVKARLSAEPLKWEAKLQFTPPKGEPVKVWASHHFKGTSIYNTLHGGQRKAIWSGARADVYVDGHTHEWACTHQEAEGGGTYWLLKARGYKFIDPYADLHGYFAHHYGATMAIIVNPAVDGPGRLHGFADLQEAADYLELIRKKA